MQHGQASTILFGFGVSKLIFGGIASFRKERTPLMTPVIPDAPSECPTLGLLFEKSAKSRRDDLRWFASYRANEKPLLTKHIGNCLGLQGVSNRRPSAMAFNKSNIVEAMQASSVIRCSH